MNYEKIRKYADLVVLIIGIILLSYLFLKHLLIYLLPFLIGWFIAFAMRSPSAMLAKKLKIKPKIARLVLTVALYLSLFGVASLAVWLLSREVWDILSGLGDDGGALQKFISEIASPDGFVGKLLGNFGDYLADMLYKVVSSMLSAVGSLLSAVVSAVPKVLFFVLISVIASAYFAVDLEEVNASIKRILPKSAFDTLVKFKDGFFGAFLKYMRSYLLLLVITFAEMLLGLSLIKAPYPLVMAIVIALLDLLPVIGVGFVLIPWGVWSFCIGRTPFGIGLLVLFAAHTVFRQIIEPKIVGKNLGMHPILTLVFIYLGYSLFGIVGLILVPVLTVLVNVAFGKEDTAEVTDSTVAKGNDG